MKLSSILAKLLLAGALSSVVAVADTAEDKLKELFNNSSDISKTVRAEVDKSNGVLHVSSDKSGTVRVKVIGPNDEVIVDRTYEGNTFSWTPSGADGAYRYDVRIEGAYAGGTIELVDGEMLTNEKEEL